MVRGRVWHPVPVAAGKTPRGHGASGTPWPALAIAALTIFFSFRAGGFFADAPALGAVVLGVALMLRVAFAERPFGRLSLGYVLGAGVLALLALWTLVSSEWSGSAARAIVEFDRVVLYLLAFVAFGAMGRGADRLRWLVRGIAAAALVVCACALVTRLLPDLWQIPPTDVDGRLSYPLTYWNALGLLAAIGLVTCLALTCDRRETAVGRVLAAGALPILGAALILTLSRGSVVAATVGILALIVVGRPRALLSGLLAGGPATALAVAAAYGAELLASERPTTPAAAAQGHEVALVVGGCVVLALAARAALLRLDDRTIVAMPAVLRHPASWVAGLAAVVLVALALGAPATVERHYDGFVGSDPISGTDLRSRLTSPGDNGRIALWRTAWGAFEQSPVHGQGAGTYALAWDRRGASDVAPAEDGHSLYVEVLAELGIVGRCSWSPRSCSC